MTFWRNNWYYIGGVLFVGMAFYMGLAGHHTPLPQNILLLQLMALWVHQVEEYIFPGGFPPVFNIAFSGEKQAPDRYPLNKLSSFVINVVLAYTLYIVAVSFPHSYWLGILISFFGFAQFVIHGIAIPRKLGSFYNPGLATVITLFIPLGVYYLWYAYRYCPVKTWEWWVGILATPVAALLMIQLPIRAFRDKQSPYPWTADEMNRFTVSDKMQRRG